MTAFVAVAALMLVAACACVLVPLLRRRRGEDVEPVAANLSVLRDQSAELERDLSNGTISAEQYDSARGDLERRVLEETRERGPNVDTARPGAWTAALVAAALPIAAIVLYLVLGMPVALSPEFVAENSPRDPAKKIEPADIEQMIERVKERLAREPGNLEGWTVLARTYYVMGRAGEAAQAFERATALAPNDAGLLADYADALGIVQNQSLEGKPAALIERALAADPDHWKANALAGSLALSRNDPAKAIAHWERVKRVVPPDSPVAQSLDASLAEARRLASASPAKTAIAPSPKDAKAAGTSVAGTVSLAASLAGSVSPDDTVFVFARPPDGSRMPVALVRGKVRDLPLAFTLDDSTAMSPTTKLSDHGEVVVVARVSKSGSATPQPGDLETTSAPIRTGASGLKLVIDRKVPSSGARQ